MADTMLDSSTGNLPGSSTADILAASGLNPSAIAPPSATDTLGAQGSFLPAGTTPIATDVTGTAVGAPANTSTGNPVLDAIMSGGSSALSAIQGMSPTTMAALGMAGANLLTNQRMGSSSSQIPAQLKILGEEAKTTGATVAANQADIAAKAKEAVTGAAQPAIDLSKNLISQYQSGAIPAGAAFDINRWKQEAIAQSRQYWTNAGPKFSSMAQQDEANINAQAASMTETARQGLLTSGLAALNTALQGAGLGLSADQMAMQAAGVPLTAEQLAQNPLLAAVQMQAQQDTALMQSQQNAMNSLFLMTALAGKTGGTATNPATAALTGAAGVLASAAGTAAGKAIGSAVGGATGPSTADILSSAGLATPTATAPASAVDTLGVQGDLMTPATDMTGFSTGETAASAFGPSAASSLGIEGATAGDFAQSGLYDMATGGAPLTADAAVEAANAGTLVNASGMAVDVASLASMIGPVMAVGSLLPGFSQGVGNIVSDVGGGFVSAVKDFFGGLF